MLLPHHHDVFNNLSNWIVLSDEARAWIDTHSAAPAAWVTEQVKNRIGKSTIQSILINRRVAMHKLPATFTPYPEYQNRVFFTDWGLQQLWFVLAAARWGGNAAKRKRLLETASEAIKVLIDAIVETADIPLAVCATIDDPVSNQFVWGHRHEPNEEAPYLTRTAEGSMLLYKVPKDAQTAQEMAQMQQWVFYAYMIPLIHFIGERLVAALQRELKKTKSTQLQRARELLLSIMQGVLKALTQRIMLNERAGWWTEDRFNLDYLTLDVVGEDILVPGHPKSCGTITACKIWGGVACWILERAGLVRNPAYVTTQVNLIDPDSDCNTLIPWAGLELLCYSTNLISRKGARDYEELATQPLTCERIPETMMRYYDTWKTWYDRQPQYIKALVDLAIVHPLSA